MNARGFMLLARLGEHVGIDLWHFETPDGRSIRKAVDFLAPFAAGEQQWPYEQINGFRPDAGITLVRRAAQEWPDAYNERLKKLPPLKDDAVEHLTGPRMVGNPLDSK